MLFSFRVRNRHCCSTHLVGTISLRRRNNRIESVHRDQKLDRRRALIEVYMHRHLQQARNEGYVDVTSHAQS
jgi:hypothetical protein